MLPLWVKLSAFTLYLIALGLAPCRVPAQSAYTSYNFTNFVGMPGGYGDADRTGAAARFWLPRGIALDKAGNIYVADGQNDTIRRVTPDGTVSTIAGSPVHTGSTDGIGTSAAFGSPWGVTVDSAGIVYVADTYNQTIRKITPGLTNWTVTTLAGAVGHVGGTDATGSAARFWYPAGIAVDTARNIYVADQLNCTIRRITQAGVVTTLAGSAGASGTNDGVGSAAGFNQPVGVAVDSASRVYVADSGNHTIRVIATDNAVSTLAGRGRYSGTNDGAGSAARFNIPSGIGVDGAGNVYVAEHGSHTVRFVTPAGVVTTLAGSAGQAGSADGTGTDARFSNPFGLAVGNAGVVYVSECGNNTLRKLAPGPTVTTLAGAPSHAGADDGVLSGARFNGPCAMASDPAGNFYVADSANNTIRKFTPAGVVTTLAGSPGLSGSADGVGSNARFNRPAGIAVDAWGTLYVADNNNSTVRSIAPDGTVRTLAGRVGQSGYQDGPSWAATFDYPVGVAVDRLLNVYVTDAGTTIRKITATGTVSTIAGAFSLYGSADGVGTAARFNGAGAMTSDSAGNLYVTDNQNGTIRKLSMVGSSWAVTTLAGSAGIFAIPLFDNGPALAADPAGNLFVADSANCIIRKLTPSGTATTLAGVVGRAGGADGLGNAAMFAHPSGVVVDGAGNVYVADTMNNRISKGTLPPLQFERSLTSLGASNGLFHARLTGPAGAGVVVESALELGFWTLVQTNVLPDSGLDLWVPMTTNQHRSFRARLAQ